MTPQQINTGLLICLAAYVLIFLWLVYVLKKDMSSAENKELNKQWAERQKMMDEYFKENVN